jgi:hypothetical protein
VAVQQDKKAEPIRIYSLTSSPLGSPTFSEIDVQAFDDSIRAGVGAEAVYPAALGTFADVTKYLPGYVAPPTPGAAAEETKRGNEARPGGEPKKPRTESVVGSRLNPSRRRKIRAELQSWGTYDKAELDRLEQYIAGNMTKAEIVKRIHTKMGSGGAKPEVDQVVMMAAREWDRLLVTADDVDSAWIEVGRADDGVIAKALHTRLGKRLEELGSDTEEVMKALVALVEGHPGTVTWMAEEIERRDGGLQAKVRQGRSEQLLADLADRVNERVEGEVGLTQSLSSLTAGELEHLKRSAELTRTGSEDARALGGGEEREADDSRRPLRAVWDALVTRRRWGKRRSMRSWIGLRSRGLLTRDVANYNLFFVHRYVREAVTNFTPVIDRRLRLVWAGLATALAFVPLFLNGERINNAMITLCPETLVFPIVAFGALVYMCLGTWRHVMLLTRTFFWQRAVQAKVALLIVAVGIVFSVFVAATRPAYALWEVSGGDNATMGVAAELPKEEAEKILEEVQTHYENSSVDEWWTSSESTWLMSMTGFVLRGKELRDRLAHGDPAGVAPTRLRNEDFLRELEDVRYEARRSIGAALLVPEDRGQVKMGELLCWLRGLPMFKGSLLMGALFILMSIVSVYAVLAGSVVGVLGLAWGSDFVKAAEKQGGSGKSLVTWGGAQALRIVMRFQLCAVILGLWMCTRTYTWYIEDSIMPWPLARAFEYPVFATICFMGIVTGALLWSWGVRWSILVFGCVVAMAVSLATWPDAMIQPVIGDLRFFVGLSTMLYLTMFFVGQIFFRTGAIDIKGEDRETSRDGVPTS